MPEQDKNSEVLGIPPVQVVSVGPEPGSKEELEVALAQLGHVARIAEKVYKWAEAHRYQVPALAWEELRVALCLPPPVEPSRIIKSSTLPANPKRRR